MSSESYAGTERARLPSGVRIMSAPGSRKKTASPPLFSGTSYLGPSPTSSDTVIPFSPVFSSRLRRKSSTYRPRVPSFERSMGSVGLAYGFGFSPGLRNSMPIFVECTYADGVRQQNSLANCQGVSISLTVCSTAAIGVRSSSRTSCARASGSRGTGIPASSGSCGTSD